MNSNVFYPTLSIRLLRKASYAAIFSMCVLFSGCTSVGHTFPAGQVSAIKVGETTQNDIYTMFGAPWRTGLDNGLKTWTYGDYKISFFEDTSAEDLVIKFDKRGVVSSYNYNTSKRSK